MIKAYAAFEANGLLKEFEYDPGELRVDDIEIDVKYCGICHSDISMIDNAWGISEYPLVPGHEVVGTISKLGENVTSLTEGQIVGLGWHSGYCNHCSYCNEGKQNLCSSSESTIVSHHGGFAEKVRAKANSVIPIPDEIELSSAGPLFCGGITFFNPLLQFNVKPTDKVAVIGIGGLGHLALKFLNAWGCEVTAFTSSKDKQAEAQKLGAQKTIDTYDTEKIEAMANSFDFIISTVNVKLDWNLLINTLKPCGRFHFVGVPLEPLDLGVFPLIMGQRSISGSPVGAPGAFSEMLDFSKHHNIKPNVEIYKFKDVNKAVDHLRNGNVKYRLVLEMK